MPNDAPPTEHAPDAALVAEQNDRFRHAAPSLAPGMATADGLRGRVVFTRAIAERGPLFPLLCLLEVARHDTFDPEDDPEGLRDFGAVEVEGRRVWFKIDLYADEAMEWGSEHPDDPSLTYRVLTVMLPSDW